MSELSPEAREEIEQFLASRPSTPCTTCGSTRLHGSKDIFAINFAAQPIMGQVSFMPVVAFTCVGCGKLNFHQLSVVAPKSYAKGGGK